MLVYILIPIMALLNRASGMKEWFPGRNIYATGILAGLAAGFITGSWFIGLLTSLAMYIYRIPGWYKSLDMGTNEGTLLGDISIMFLRSAMFGIPFIAANFALTTVGITLAGAALATLGYYLAWHSPIKKLNPNDPTLLSELMAGAALGLALVGFISI